MNRIRSVWGGGILSAIVLVSIVALFTGCQTGPEGRNIEGAVKAASYIGTALTLQDNPEYRDHFAQAVADLTLIEQQERIDWVTVVAIVQRLPIKELKSQEAVLIITTTTILLQDHLGQVGLETAKVKPIVTAMREGMQLGLGAAVARSIPGRSRSALPPLK